MPACFSDSSEDADDEEGGLPENSIARTSELLEYWSEDLGSEFPMFESDVLPSLEKNIMMASSLAMGVESSSPSSSNHDRVDLSSSDESHSSGGAEIIGNMANQRSYHSDGEWTLNASKFTFSQDVSQNRDA